MNNSSSSDSIDLLIRQTLEDNPTPTMDDSNTSTEKFEIDEELLKEVSQEDDFKDKVKKVLNSYSFVLDDLDLNGIVDFVATQMGIYETNKNKWDELKDIISEYMMDDKEEKAEAEIFGKRLDMEIDEPNETILYHSAHGGIREHGLLQEKKNILLPDFNPNKKVTILLKTKSMVGSTVLTSKTTETGVFGIDFKNKEIEFSDYLKITISYSRIIMIELFNPLTLEWSVFYSEDIDRGKIFDIPNIEFTYGERDFKTGILELSIQLNVS